MIHDILDRTIKVGDLVIRCNDGPEIFIVVTKSKIFNAQVGYASPRKPVYLITNPDDKEKEYQEYLKKELEYKKWSDATNKQIIQQIAKCREDANYCENNFKQFFIRGHVYCVTDAELLLCVGHGQKYNKFNNVFDEGPIPFFIMAAADYAAAISGKMELQFDFSESSIHPYQYKINHGAVDVTDKLEQELTKFNFDEQVPTGTFIENEYTNTISYLQKDDEVLTVNEFLAMDLISGDIAQIPQHFDDAAFF